VRRLWLVILVVSLVASPGAAATTVSTFRMPSGRISCLYAPKNSLGPAYLRCDGPLNPPPRGQCGLDWTGLSMAPIGRARPTCAGDTVADPHSRVLAYGRTWRRGGIACSSRRIGLRCTNRSGHGFFLSRESWVLF
jgi:hypothetical protein